MEKPNRARATGLMLLKFALETTLEACLKELEGDDHAVMPALNRALEKKVTTNDAERVLMGYLSRNPAALTQHIQMAADALNSQTEKMISMLTGDYGDLADPQLTDERKSDDKEEA